MNYKVLNPLLSVRASTDANSEDYGKFIEWKTGDIIKDYPPHTDIEGWHVAGHIEEVKDGKIKRTRR